MSNKKDIKIDDSMLSGSVINKKTNIIGEERLNETKKYVLETMRNSISHTLGPSGANTLVTDPSIHSSTIPSKDGVRLVNDLKFSDMVADSLYRMIADISNHLNTEVGDGTTSGIVIVDELYNKVKTLLDTMEPAPTPAGVINLFDVLTEVLIEELPKKYTQKFDLTSEDSWDILKKIATVSANNDPVIGEMLANIFKERNSSEVFVNVELGFSEDTMSYGEEGFEMASGYISNFMATESDGQLAKYEKPKFLLVNGPITDNDADTVFNILNVVCSTGQPMVLVAADYSVNVRSALERNRLTGIPNGNGGRMSFNCLAISLNSLHPTGKKRLSDLEVILGAKALKTYDGKIMDLPTNSADLDRVLGSADVVESLPYNTRIKGGGGYEDEIKARVDELKEKLKTIDPQDDYFGWVETKKRIAMLNRDMVTIKVGGVVMKQAESRKFLIEDAVYALRSTLNNGYTVGGNVSVYKALNDIEIVEKIVQNLLKRTVTYGNDESDVRSIATKFIKVVAKAFVCGYEQVIRNCYGSDPSVIKEIINNVLLKKDLKVFNVVTERYEESKVTENGLEIPTTNQLIVPGNTDVEIVKAVFSVLSIFMSSNQMLTALPGDFELWQFKNVVKD